MAIETLIRDCRYTARALRRNPGFTTFAVLIVGLGIGASTTVFSVVNTLLLRPLPFAAPEQLVWIANRDTSGLSGQTTQVGHLLDLRERSRTLSGLAGYFAFYGVGDHVLSGGGEAERLSGVPVSQNFFDVLGIRPVIGRTFNDDESRWRGPKAVLISDGLWRRRFASDPGVVGKSVTLNDEAHVVVGVMPASFDFASVFAPGGHFDLLLPFALAPETNRWGNTMAMIGRLESGVTVAQAQAEIKVLAAEIVKAHPERNGFGGVVKPLAEQVSGRMRLALLVLTGAVAVVMLIVCANLANLLLARASSRQKEMAIRTAMGAGRWRLTAHLLTEGLMLSGAGALVGVVLAIAGTRVLASLDAVSVPLLSTVRVDVTALSVALLIALLTGIAVGLAPALHTSGPLHDALKDTGRGSTEGRGRRWAGQLLVVSEVAFACMLLVGAGLLIRSFVRVLDVDLGFRPEDAATIRVDPGRQYATREQQLAYFDDVLDRVRSIPGVTAAGITDALPLGRNRTWGAGAKGKTYERGRFPVAFVRVVSDGYVAAMGIPVKAGRDFSPHDRETTGEPVMLVNETMARTVWPGEDPIGKFVLGGCAKERRVVGVVGDVRHLALEQTSGNEMYIPMRQCDDLPSADLVLRSAVPPDQLALAVRTILRPLAPNLAGNELRRMQARVDASVSPRRFLVLLLGGFAAFALILAALGIYALISYSVNQRTREIGIRMALGASAGAVQARVLMQTMRLAAIGLVIGAALSWWLARSVSGLLFEIPATDPATFVGMLAALAIVAALAGYLPARRAARIDPLIAFRAE